MSVPVNLPNYITLSRIAAIPLIIWILTTPYFGAKDATLRAVLASTLFILASITDGLDGYLARRRGQITTMGMLLDPLADKLLMLFSLAALYIVNVTPLWLVGLVVARDVTIVMGWMLVKLFALPVPTSVGPETGAMSPAVNDADPSCVWVRR